MTIVICMCLLALSASPAQQLLASNVVRAYGDDKSDDRAVFSDPVRVPPNVAIPAAYADVVGTMLRSSPTFRSQCTRIARATYLHLTVERSLLAPRQAAETRVTRGGAGTLLADVQVSPFGDPVMLLAHEFEHVIEQLDGVDLAAMADRPGTGVRTDPRSGQFETERAIAVGQRVAREVSRGVASQ